ncbi:MAG: hypothetical protein IT285_09250, partial [Bdellovibrionales bacterium]|nr:hypothetical protein [Bdellovibrionales bacterium]
MTNSSLTAAALLSISLLGSACLGGDPFRPAAWEDARDAMAPLKVQFQSVVPLSEALTALLGSHLPIAELLRTTAPSSAERLAGCQELADDAGLLESTLATRSETFQNAINGIAGLVELSSFIPSTLLYAEMGENTDLVEPFDASFEELDAVAALVNDNDALR